MMILLHVEDAFQTLLGGLSCEDALVREEGMGTPWRLVFVVVVVVVQTGVGGRRRGRS